MATRTCLYKKKKYLSRSRCFQVSPNVRYTENPSNGEEYLLKVIRERSNYPKISVCDFNELSKKLAKKEYSVSPSYEEIENPTSPIALKPTIEWQNLQLALFSDVRKYIQDMFDKGLVPFAIRNIKVIKYSINAWLHLFNKKEPTMTQVVVLSQAVIDTGLNVMMNQLDLVEPGHTIDQRTGRWIYSLLAVTKYPHLKDTTARLRALARKCLEIRSKLNAEEESAKELAAPMNIFICIIAGYFGQKDLGDGDYLRAELLNTPNTSDND